MRETKEFDLGLLEKNLKEDKIKFNLNGHFSGERLNQKYLKQSFHRDIEYHIKHKRFMEKSFNERLKVNPENADIVTVNLVNCGSESIECPYCGDRLSYIYESESEVTLGCMLHTGNIGDGTFKRTLSVEPCKYKDGVKPMKSIVNFKTNRIIFTDYFRSKDDFLLELPDDVNYGSEHSLQHYYGRQNLMNYYAKNFDTGYAQMGNMSIKILINEAKTKIIITECYPENYDEGDHMEEDYDKLIESGFTDLGDVSLSMWRWMCLETKKLEDNEVEIRGEDDYNDYIETDIVAGDWEITHYYDNQECPKGSLHIYSEINLV